MNKYTISFLLLIGLLVTSVYSKSGLPAHPSEIEYSNFDWEPPLGSPYRKTLKNGLKVYIAEDRKVPMVTISGYIEGGSLNDPKGLEGLSSFATKLMRTGGTENFSSDSLDELIDRYAMSISVGASETMIKFGATFLSQHTDIALQLLNQILFHPAFNSERVEKEREITLSSLEHRFDNPEPVLSVSWIKTMYPDMENSSISTAKTIKAINIDQMKSFHKSNFKTSKMIMAISGDFDEKDMSKKLIKYFPKSKSSKPASNFPSIKPSTTPQFVIIHKEISQAYIKIGLPLIKRPNPDYYPLSVFNYILGGGGFTSKLGQSIRSDRGLTYSIRSSAGSNYFYPALFTIGLFTKSESVNEAIFEINNEIKKLLKTGITKEELDKTTTVLLGSLPSMFRSKGDITDTYAWNEYHGRSEDHFRVYDDKLKALTTEQVNATARKWLKPENLTYVIVGDTTELFKTEPYNNYSIKEVKDKKIFTQDLLETGLKFE